MRFHRRQSLFQKLVTTFRHEARDYHRRGGGEGDERRIDISAAFPEIRSRVLAYPGREQNAFLTVKTNGNDDGSGSGKISICRRTMLIQMWTSPQKNHSLDALVLADKSRESSDGFTWENKTECDESLDNLVFNRSNDSTQKQIFSRARRKSRWFLIRLCRGVMLLGETRK